jgi:hypothetical protein
MTVTTNTLGTNSAEIVIQGPDSWQNVITAVDAFLISHGWSQVPNVALTTTLTASAATTNVISVSSTTGFIAGMPIQVGTSVGGLNSGQTYYVLTILGSTTMTVSTANVLQNSSATAVTLTTTNSQTVTLTSFVNAGVGLTGNSNNYRQRVYYAPNLTGSPYKYICVNWMDLSIDTAQAFALGTLNGSYYYYSGTNTAYKFNHYQHFSYPRDSYFYSSTNPTIGTQVTLSPNFVWLNQSAGSNQYTSNIYSSGGFGTITLAASLGYAFYPGQLLVAYSPSTGNYSLATVASWTESSGSLVMNNPFFGTANGSTSTDWVLLNTNLAYNTPSNYSPAYVYITATARHIAIQTRNIDGVWNDWNTVCELENPLGLQNNWGLTTGYMAGNTGYTEAVNGGNGYLPQGFALNTTGFSVIGVSNTTNYSVSNGALNRQTPVTFSNKNYKYTLFTGPMSMPLTYKARTSSFASQTSKIVTPLGEAGYMTTLRKSMLVGYQVSNTISVAEVASVYFRGLGDVTPTQPSVPGTSSITNLTTTATAGTGSIATISFAIQASNPFAIGQNITVSSVTPTGYNGTYAVTAVTTSSVSYASTTTGSQTVAGSIQAASGTTHWAISGSLITDIGDDNNITAFLINSRADTIEGINSFTLPVSSASYTNLGVFGSYRDQSQYRTNQPTVMGRIYNMKVVTTGLAALSAMSIKTDASGFVNSAGSATTHIVFNYPSYYTSPTLAAFSGYVGSNGFTSKNTATSIYDGYGSLQITITATATNGNITTSSTFTTTGSFSVYQGQTVTFSGAVAGGIVAGTIYYATAYFSSGSTFTVAAYPGGPVLTWAATSAQSFTATIGSMNRESAIEQAAIRLSQSVSVAFPR